MSKRVLITGGGGFIGSNLSLQLLDRGYDVTVLDNYSPQIHGDDYEASSLYQQINGKVKIVVEDIRNEKVLTALLHETDIVVHLVAETGTGQSMYEIHRYTNVNIDGTGLMLDIIANQDTPVRKVVVASSRAIYGEGRYRCVDHDVVYPLARADEHLSKGDFGMKCPICAKPVELMSTTEESKIHPTSIYGITKQVQEQLVMVGCQAIGVEATALRYQNVYGPGQSLKNPYTGILSIFSTRILNGNDINIFEDGTESRDFVYIDDVVDATIKAIEVPAANGESFNIGTGVPTSVLDVTKTLVHSFGAKDIKYNVTGNYRLGDIRHNYADLDKAKRILNFEPKVNFKEGIKRFVDWVKTQQIQEDKYEASLQEMKEKGLYK